MPFPKEDSRPRVVPLNDASPYRCTALKQRTPLKHVAFALATATAVAVAAHSAMAQSDATATIMPSTASATSTSNASRESAAAVTPNTAAVESAAQATTIAPVSDPAVKSNTLSASSSGVVSTGTLVSPETKPSADMASAATPLVSAPSVPPIASPTTTTVIEAAPGNPDSTSSFRAMESIPTDLWDRIRVGYAMEDLDDELVGKWEKFYAERPDYMARIVERSGKYLFYIVTELERRNMPLEIALLPMIESAFNPIAHSTAKASGIWQFIPSTGTQFGMKQDWWADSRRDIVQATNGALEYLQKLHGMFGDWQLALASYNWGEGSVGRAVARSKAAGRDGTYLTLNMPAETRNYLPKLQAVKNIIRDPARFGLTIASIPNEPYFKTVTLAHAIDLKKAAQFADMTEAEFVALNPAHHRPVIAGRNDFQILLPAAKADLFISRLESYENPKVSWRAYKTRSGDRIEALAQRFGTTVSALRSVNGIRAMGSSLPVGYNLLVPSDGPSDDALGSIQNAVFTKFPEYVAPRAHRVRKGETFVGIAKRYGVAPTTLAKWNRMSKQSARAGQLLYVSGPAPTRTQAKQVRAGTKSKNTRASTKAGAKRPVKMTKKAAPKPVRR